MHVKFRSDSSSTGRGFRLRYEAGAYLSVQHTNSLLHNLHVFFVLPPLVCDRNLTSPSGVVESLNFPGLYPHSLNCSYRIVGPTGALVGIQFEQFEIEFHDNCNYDSVTVLFTSFQI